MAEWFGSVRVGWLSATWPSGLERCFYDGHDRKVDGSTPTQALLLCPWIRCFMAIISARRNLTSSKSKRSQAKFKYLHYQLDSRHFTFSQSICENFQAQVNLLRFAKR